MALIIISLLVLVPLALLGWDLARQDKTGGQLVEGPGTRQHRANPHQS